MAEHQTETAPTEDTEPAWSNARMRLTAVIVASALFMQSLDSTIIATALPAMARSFHTVPLHMSVALTSYLIALAVFIPASGWVADRFGARQVFRAAIVVFTIGSVLCGIAPSLPVLVGSRVLQGMGGAMMVPVGRLVLMRSISHSQMVSAMSWLTVPALLGPVIGPPLGGFIVSFATWRWVFDINVPIGIIGTIAVSLYIQDVREEGQGGRLDAWGLLLSGFAMALLMMAFETTGRDLVPVSWTASAYAAGFAACALYWRHARRHPHPVIDLTLFAITNFAIPALAGSLFRIAVGALPFLLPLMLQLDFGFTPLASGLVTFTAAAGAMLMKPAAPPLLARFGFRNVLVWNGVFAALAMSLCAAFEKTWPSIVMNLILFAGGFLRSLQFTAFNVIAYGEIPRARMSAATSLYSTIQQLSLTLGIVVGATTLDIASRLHHHTQATKADYALAFIVVSFIALLASPFCARLDRHAGESMSGHHAAEP
ncbi:DHA2 family efflux MFS transporter permease subunit [Acidocella sp.]|uniref:DHA2 family efflux MFS transporter permease subunit n=1 Tax=Acidocella sp. TaxID=50710 RepID=UPI00261AF9C9|nr:DHA2 family efflux MFS transporter permease subunit [Acidocella sp.]